MSYPNDPNPNTRYRRDDEGWGMGTMLALAVAAILVVGGLLYAFNHNASTTASNTSSPTATTTGQGNSPAPSPSNTPATTPARP